MGWIKTMLAEFGRADSQRMDWYGWVTNQCGHVLIGLTWTWVVMIAGAAPILAASAVLALYALKEWRDVRRGGGLGDSLTDLAFVASGCAMALTMRADAGGFFLIILLITLFLALRGIRKRILRGVNG